nr:protein clec16a [Hymenolepis microstoma]
MFSRSKNSGLQNSKKLHSVEYLKYLYTILQKNYNSSDCHVDEVVESLRLFSEIIVWGDQNDGSIMDFFLEQNALELLINYLDHRKKDRRICTQLLQSLNILFENLTNSRAIYYLLSQNHTNNIILHEFDFSDEEIVGYYIAFLKSLSFRKALQLFDHSENMVRIAVRTITLNIFNVKHEACLLYVYSHTSVPYFSHLTEEIRRTAFAVNDFFCLNIRRENRGRIEDLVAETGDHLHYIDDIFALGVVDLTNVLCLVLLRRLFLPIYVYSLNKRHPQKDTSRGNYLFHALAMFFLSQVFTILHQPELIRILTEAILIGDLTLLLPPSKENSTNSPNSTDSSAPLPVFNVIAFLRAAHHGKWAARFALPGHRLQAFLQTITTCGVVDSGFELSSSLSDDIAQCSKCIMSFQNRSTQNYEEHKAEGNDAGMSSSQSSTELTSQIAMPPSGMSPLTPRLQRTNSSAPLTNDAVSSEGTNSGFTLAGRPFLRSLFRSLEVGPGTDYDTFFALSLLIAIKRNGGLDEGTLALAQLHTPSQESPCNSMLITKILDIISDAIKMGSRVRVATLNLALFLLVLVTRDSSMKCQLTENQLQHLETAFLECRNILRDLYMTEPDFGDIFEFELCRYRAQKLDPSKLLENTVFLFSHLEDALKLFSNHFEENLSSPLSNAALTNENSQAVSSFNLQDIPPYTTLPSSQLESIQRMIAVYFCLKGYLCSYVFLNGEVKTISSSTSEPMNEVTSPGLERVHSLASFGNIPPRDRPIVGINDFFDITDHQIFSCEVVHQSGRTEKRYLLISDVQIIFLEPSPRKIGFGVVTFTAYLQDTELHIDPTDGKVLSIVVYKSGDRAGVTVHRLMKESGITSNALLPNVFHRLNTKLRFLDSMQCSTIYTLVTQHLEKIRAAKQEKLKLLLNVPDKPRSSAQALMNDDVSRLRISSLPSGVNRSLKTIYSAPTTLLQKSGLTQAPPPINLVSSLTNSSTSPGKKADDGQEIPMVELPKRVDSNNVTTGKTPKDSSSE